MTYPRAHLVHANEAGYYHCISRCVRRGWLCGFDSVSGRSYEHRKPWVEHRILTLARLFSVDVFGYAVMSNHYHLVVRVDPLQPISWSAEDVAERWVELTGPSDQEARRRAVSALSLDSERLDVLRERLGSLSWFMRFLNEPIARAANREDGCTGRFWEGRFKSMALLDNEAIIACMAYADLNPRRAGLPHNVASAPFTSVYRRRQRGLEHEAPLAPLSVLGLTLTSYVSLLESVAESDLDSANSRLGPLSTDNLRKRGLAWAELVSLNKFGYRAYGSVDRLKCYAQALGQRWVRGQRQARLVPG